jgi:fused signal recognition particle receptor
MRSALRESIIATLTSRGGDTALSLPPDGEGPAVILIVGVNGAGKTTTIGKLAHKFTAEGAKVMLGSGDTFRAAAFEQLQTWGQRTGSLMGTFVEGSGPAQVLSRAVIEAKQADCDVVLCDTSGRLHTNWRLMEELEEVKREVAKTQEGAPHEALLVLDGSTGLNMINQVRVDLRMEGEEGESRALATRGAWIGHCSQVSVCVCLCPAMFRWRYSTGLVLVRLQAAILLESQGIMIQEPAVLL